MTEIEKAARQALEALEKFAKGESSGIPVTVLTTALRQALEQQPADYDQGWKDGYKHGAWASEQQPADEPVAWINWSALTGKRSLSWTCGSEIASEPLYTRPQPAAQWVGLTDEEREAHRDSWKSNIHDEEFEEIEAKLREKNGGKA